MVTTPSRGECINGAILYDEMIRQLGQRLKGLTFAPVLASLLRPTAQTCTRAGFEKVAAVVDHEVLERTHAGDRRYLLGEPQ